MIDKDESSQDNHKDTASWKNSYVVYTVRSA